MAAATCQCIMKLFGCGLFLENFREKHFFITGGSTGIGLAVAKKAIAEGAYVTITGRNRPKLLEAMEILNIERSKAPNSEDSSRPRVVIKVVDVSDYEAMESAMQDVPIDVLVCNAGVTHAGFLDEISQEATHNTVSTNVLGVMYTVRAALPMMKARSHNHRSSIVVIGSLASMFCMYGHGIYTATKYAVKGYAECLRLELVPYQIRVTLVCPGFVATPFLNDAERDPEVTRQMAAISHYDRNKADTPEHVAEVIAKGIKQGKFLVTNEPIGNAVFILARGFMPAESTVRALLEAVLFFPLRLFSMLASYRVKKYILKRHRRSMTASQSQANPGESSES